MHDDAFEWEEAKAAKNYAAHGVSFEAARGVSKTLLALNGSITVSRTAKTGLSSSA